MIDGGETLPNDILTRILQIACECHSVVTTIGSLDNYIAFFLLFYKI